MIFKIPLKIDPSFQDFVVSSYKIKNIWLYQIHIRSCSITYYIATSLAV